MGDRPAPGGPRVHWRFLRNLRFSAGLVAHSLRLNLLSEAVFGEVNQNVPSNSRFSLPRAAGQERLTRRARGSSHDRFPTAALPPPLSATHGLGGGGGGTRLYNESLVGELAQGVRVRLRVRGDALGSLK